MFLAISCTSESFVELFKVIASFVRILYVLIVVALIVYTMIDFAKVVMSEKVDSGAAFKTLAKKLITTVLALLIIPIVVFVLSAFTGDTGSSTVVTNCTDVIIEGLKNPASISAPSSEANDEEDTEDAAAARLTAFKTRCSALGGVYSSENKATYRHDDANVVDSFEDETKVHLCKMVAN